MNTNNPISEVKPVKGQAIVHKTNRTIINVRLLDGPMFYNDTEFLLNDLIDVEIRPITQEAKCEKCGRTKEECLTEQLRHANALNDELDSELLQIKGERRQMSDNNTFAYGHGYNSGHSDAFQKLTQLQSLLEAERKKSEEYEKALEWLEKKTHSLHMVNWDRWVVTTKQIEVVGEGTTPLAAIRSAMAKEKEEKKEGGK